MEFNFVYALNYVIAITRVLSVAYSLVKLSSMEMNPAPPAILAAVIVLVPFLGVMAFLLTTGRQLKSVN